MTGTLFDVVSKGHGSLVLEEHQKEATAKVVKAWETVDRATVVMACGTGKTIVGLAATIESVWAHKGARICVFVPSLALVKQTLETWRTYQPWGKQFRTIAVCSDRRIDDDDIGADEIPTEVTTDPRKLLSFFDACSPRTVAVVFATYHSQAVLADAMRARGLVLDLGIADEAHNTAGSAEKAFGLMLSDDAIPIRKRLFMTATPRIVRKRGYDLVSMDDEAVYGETVYTLSFREAVRRGIICDWEVLVCIVTPDEAQALGLNKAVHGLSSSKLQEAAGRAAISKAIKLADVRKVVSFHNTVLAARDFAEDRLSNSRAMQGFDVFHVSGADKRGRHSAMSAFASARKGLVSNARCLTEGVDVPAIDLIAFLGRKSSKIDIVQAIGRALRKAPGKTKGYILLPVLLDLQSGQSPEEALADSDLALVWDVLSAMRENDTLFASSLPRLSQSGKVGESTSVLSPSWVRILGDVDIEAIRRGLEVIALDELLTPFDHGVSRLRQFAELNGHALVPASYCDSDGFCLGTWVASRRREYRNGTLSQPRVDALESTPGWVWDRDEDRWSNGLSSLKKYAAVMGSARVPAGYIDTDGFPLGNWVRSRRNDYSSGRLGAARVKSLSKFSDWSWSRYADDWDAAFEALKSYLEREKHSSPPDSFVTDGGLRLGEWVSTQRRAYAAEKLSAVREARLRTLQGWDWSAQDALWRAGLAALEQFVARNKHCDVPSDYVTPDGQNLYAWCKARRADKRLGRLADERVAQLIKIDGWVWEKRASSWDRGLKELKAYVCSHGHAAVPTNYVTADGFKLGQWVRVRRTAKLAGRLSRDNAKELTKLPGWRW